MKDILLELKDTISKPNHPNFDSLIEKIEFVFDYCLKQTNALIYPGIIRFTTEEQKINLYYTDKNNFRLEAELMVLSGLNKNRTKLFIQRQNNEVCFFVDGGNIGYYNSSDQFFAVASYKIKSYPYTKINMLLNVNDALTIEDQMLLNINAKKGKATYNSYEERSLTFIKDDITLKIANNNSSLYNTYLQRNNNDIQEYGGLFFDINKKDNLYIEMESFDIFSRLYLLEGKLYVKELKNNKDYSLKNKPYEYVAKRLQEINELESLTHDDLNPLTIKTQEEILSLFSKEIKRIEKIKEKKSVVKVFETVKQLYTFSTFEEQNLMKIKECLQIDDVYQVYLAYKNINLNNKNQIKI